jgi:hypothetical protein
VAFVIDDIASVSPWRVRGIEIRGEAENLDTGGTELGPGFAPGMFRITPQRIVSWGLGGPMWFNARSVPDHRLRGKAPSQVRHQTNDEHGWMR